MVEGLTGLAENIDAGGGQIVQSMDPVIGYMGNSVCCAFHPNPGGLGLNGNSLGATLMLCFWPKEAGR